MAKSKKPRIHYHEVTGQPLVFDFGAYLNLVKQQADEQGIPQKAVMRRIAQKIWPDEDPEVKADATRKWKNGKNGPRYLSDIRKIEKTYDCSLLVPFKPESKIKEERKADDMNTSGPSSISLSLSPTDQEERLAAQEAYHTLSDLIANHKKMMLSYASTSNFASAFALGSACPTECIPESFPAITDIQCTLRKLRFNLPYSVYVEATMLAESIYGLNTRSDPILSDDRTFDLTNVQDDFSRYVHKYDIQIDDDLSLWANWIDYATDQAEMYYEALEDIFDDYLK
jgi:hypothetical protein